MVWGNSLEYASKYAFFSSVFRPKSDRTKRNQRADETTVDLTFFRIGTNGLERWDLILSEYRVHLAWTDHKGRCVRL